MRMLRGKQLDEAIEKELQLMLVQGYDDSPITNTSLHKRLVAKGYLRGGLSTLSTPARKKLINTYISEQIQPLGLNDKETQLYINKQTKKAFLNDNKRLKNRISELEYQLERNTETLIRIIEEVKLKTDIPIDHLLAVHLLEKQLAKES